MQLKKILLGAAMAVSVSAMGANAATTFVGSWDVYNAAAPQWAGSPPNGPLAYTAQEAAALLYGGVASDYVISTVDASVANINNMGWYDVIGFGGKQFAQSYSSKYLGLYYGPTSGYACGAACTIDTNAASAFVRDNLSGQNRINFAFRIDAVPEPATWALMITGFGLVGATLRRRRVVAA